MTSEDQQPTIEFLSSPHAWGDAATGIERVDTHISIVWLVGPRAYKLKRAVRFDYVDFSSAERRRIACEQEILVNRRTAPGLYRGVVPITREDDGRLAIGGRGSAVDWLVVMERFDQATLFDRLAARGALDPRLMERLAAAIAALHEAAAVRPEHGGEKGMAWVIDGNAASFAAAEGGVLDRQAGARAIAAARALLARDAPLLEQRRRDGRVRECHGDLHLRNICLVDGEPTLFDAVEFNPLISCIDVLYDLAFLLMDLWHRALHGHANRVFNVYLSRTGDLPGLAALPLFLACRAAVRAKTTAAAARLQSQAGGARDRAREAGEYLALAGALAAPAGPALIAVGGFSGTGKSTLARGLAPAVGAVPGAVILRSDGVRKRLAGVAEHTTLPPAAYAPAVSRQVYDILARDAGVALRAGHAVIVDAVHAGPADRDRIERVAAAVRVPFLGLWVDADRAVLERRLTARRGDVSDATGAVLDAQLRAGAGEVRWRHLDGDRSPERVRTAALSLVRDAAIPLGDGLTRP